MSSGEWTRYVPSSMSDVTEPADRYKIALAPPARRAITTRLPPDVAAAAVDLMTGPSILPSDRYAPGMLATSAGHGLLGRAHEAWSAYTRSHDRDA
jgi:hypothetical protein